MSFDFAAFREQAEQANRSLLTGLDVRSLKIVAVDFTPEPSPKKPTTPRKPKAKAAPIVSKDVEGQVAERDARGLRSSSRVRNKMMSVTPDKEERGEQLDSGNEEKEYDEGGRKVKTQAAYVPNRLGKRTETPKKYGPIRGIAVGTLFQSRMDASTASVHGPVVAGIATGPGPVGKRSVASICASGGYVGDIDMGERLTFSGSGGRNLTGTKDQPRNLRTAPQSADMRWDENERNQALLYSCTSGKPIRLMRGFKNQSAWAPAEGYRYDGLYQAVKAWEDVSPEGFKICRVALVRLPGQPPLLVHPQRDHLVGQADAEADDPTFSMTAALSRRTSASFSSAQESVETPLTTPEVEKSEEEVDEERDVSMEERTSQKRQVDEREAQTTPKRRRTSRVA
ncbi:E3 ubiquitin-protein ligase UHRF1 [Rhodotorula toruloides]|uniref:E3 ubiquitin-protein ligase UHRF1 n=1 Tax=Rhodotorula toruloides TaxID=5286 RepID=A0A511K794_RHOTO|nr:E3 ubiquitin-protein ligase UHRF1 [Rhodotorula toruloides]